MLSTSFSKGKNLPTRIKFGPKPCSPSISNRIFGMFPFGHYGIGSKLGSSGFTRANGSQGMRDIIPFGTPQGRQVLVNTRNCVGGVAHRIINQCMGISLSVIKHIHWFKHGSNHGRVRFNSELRNGGPMPTNATDSSWANYAFLHR